jgi:hypothetical protein
MAGPDNSLTVPVGVGYGAGNASDDECGSEVVPVRELISAGGCPGPPAVARCPVVAPARTPLVLPGAALLALAMSLRARGLRGLDVLRRSVDRAPPTVS